MKKTNHARSKPCRPIGFLLFLCLIFFSASSLSAQSSAKKGSSSKFGTFNNLVNYTGDLEAIPQVLNTYDATQINTAQTNMKQYYQEMSGIAIGDSMLEIMLEPTSANYDVWMAVYNDVKANHSEQDLFVLRSIIMNIKSKL